MLKKHDRIRLLVEYRVGQDTGTEIRSQAVYPKGSTGVIKYDQRDDSEVMVTFGEMPEDEYPLEYRDVYPVEVIDLEKL